MLVVPGDHFGMDGYLRIGFGEEVGYLREGLEPRCTSCWRASDARIDRRYVDRRGVILDLILIGFGNVGAALRRACSTSSGRRSPGNMASRRASSASRRGATAGVLTPAASTSVRLVPDRRASPVRWPSMPRRRERPRTTLAFLRDALDEKPRRRARAAPGRRRDDDARHRARRAGDESHPRRARRRARTSSPRTRDRWRSPTRALRRRGRACRSPLLFEGAVMDGVPVFNLVRETMPAVNDPRLPRRREQHDELHPHRDGTGATRSTTALAEMQARGIAEADPSLDIDGWDAAAKTAALANVLLGARHHAARGRASGHHAGRSGSAPSRRRAAGGG